MQRRRQLRAADATSAPFVTLKSAVGVSLEVVALQIETKLG